MRKLLLSALFAFTAASASAQCTDLFISEYLEGTSNNKAIEIYNPTSATVNLANYKMYRSNNGSPVWQDSLAMVGMLAPGAVYVMGNPSADPAIISVSDTLHTITFFNGDDALMLKNISTNTQLDYIGILGVDPGVNWAVGSGFTSENTLVRMMSVQSGTTNWAVGATQYDVYPQNTFSFLGSHSMTPCGPVINPVISFTGASTTQTEDNITLTLTVNIDFPNPISATSVDVVLNAGGTSASDPADYLDTIPVTLTWPANDSTPKQIYITIVEDFLVEADETIQYDLTGATGGATYGTSSHTITIIDDDIPQYDIGTVNTTDVDGVADSLAVTCRLSGIVYGYNLRPTGLQFTLRDATGGIGIFSPGPVSGYTVNESDSISVIGNISQFNGLTQITIDSVEYHSTGHTLETPDVVSALDETTESDLVEFQCMHLVDPAQWTGAGSGFNCDITDGTVTVQMRIDADVDLYTMPAPTGNFLVRGIGGQFDSSSPYTSGYQLLPRYSADIITSAGPVDIGADTIPFCAPDTILLDATSSYNSYLWCSGETTSSISVSMTGSYCVVVRDDAGCTYADTVELVTPDPVVALFSTSTTGFTIDFTDLSTGSPNSWTWDFGDFTGTSTLQNPSYLYSAAGTYIVTLIACNDCYCDTILDTVEVFVGMSGPVQTTLNVYPVPASGSLTVEADGMNGPAEISLLDMTGRVVMTRTVTATAAMKEQLPLNLPSGVYMLRLRHANGEALKKIVVE